ncbi:MAG: hypothetical protein ACOYT4_05080 [Nanoarchaeota archaeon]
MKKDLFLPYDGKICKIESRSLIPGKNDPRKIYTFTLRTFNGEEKIQFYGETDIKVNETITIYEKHGSEDHLWTDSFMNQRNKKPYLSYSSLERLENQIKQID